MNGYPGEGGAVRGFWFGRERGRRRRKMMKGGGGGGGKWRGGCSEGDEI